MSVSSNVTIFVPQLASQPAFALEAQGAKEW